MAALKPLKCELLISIEGAKPTIIAHFQIERHLKVESVSADDSRKTTVAATLRVGGYRAEIARALREAALQVESSG
jgi:hypothetical protein